MYILLKAREDVKGDKGRTIRIVLGKGGGNFRAARISSLTFPLQEYFSVCKNVFSGLLAVHEIFFSQFSLA